jgi:stage II sporulation protein R
MYKTLAAIILFTALLITGSYFMLEKGEPLADAVLRLHVIANSDEPADQILKLAVKDAVVQKMSNEFRETADAREAKMLAVKNIPEIKKTAESIINAEGYDYPVEIYVGEYEFPTKSYGNIIFPQGEYQAVRVVIGEGKGKNWWCVLFPPLCLMSSSEEGLSMSSPEEAQISFKCLELLPKGVKLGSNGSEE